MRINVALERRQSSGRVVLLYEIHPQVCGPDCGSACLRVLRTSLSDESTPSIARSWPHDENFLILIIWQFVF